MEKHNCSDATYRRTIGPEFSKENGKVDANSMGADNTTFAPYFLHDAGHHGKEKCVYNVKLLLSRDEIPRHLQFNPYIYTGYRPLLTFCGCIQSLLYFHNETINILTHAIPMLYMFIYWDSLMPWKEITVPVLPWIHLVSAVSPWVGSTVYHLFMNHTSGERCYKRLLHLDMFGIWITQSFGALTTVYASVSCLHLFWIWNILIIYSFVSLWCLYKALAAASAIARRFCFSLALVMQLFVLSWRVSPYGGGSAQATKHYAGQDILAVLGGFIGALRMPERWVPGRLDLAANSHHIMHIIVVYAVYHLHQGALLDMKWLSNSQACQNYSLEQI